MGRKRAKNHLELGVFIKQITGPVDAVCWLNRFGHSNSHDDPNQTNMSLVPNHIQSSVFVTFCYNNCDHSMESIYNTTLHGTNSIIIQQLDRQQVEATGNNSTIVSTERRRSFKSIYHNLQPYTKEKERKNPIPIRQVDTKDNQVIHGWKGFL